MEGKKVGGKWEPRLAKGGIPTDISRVFGGVRGWNLGIYKGLMGFRIRGIRIREGKNIRKIARDKRIIVNIIE